MGEVAVGLALQPAESFREAALPLLAAGEVELLEWSFDVGWSQRLPDWVDPLLDHYAGAGALTGHGVDYSLLSAGDDARRAEWLERLGRERRARRYRHISEHFGFMRAGRFSDGPPLPVPRSPAFVALGHERMARLCDAAGAPVGLENLALAFFSGEARGHGAFVAELCVGVDGWLLLDLHNLYCQMENFSLSADELLAHYPLPRVREIHISGGSCSESQVEPGRRVRRDTHDGRVPDPVFDLLAALAPRCPALDAVVLEQLPESLASPVQAEGFRQDFRRARALIRRGETP